MTAKSAAIEDIDDIFWDAELLGTTGKDRRWIIPDKDDLDPPENMDSSENDASVLFSFSWSVDTISHNFDCDIIVRILEERGRGVWDAVGGEVWEASLLLSIWLRENLEYIRTLASDDSVSHWMELGCGVALPSLYVSNFLSHRSSRKMAQDAIYLTLSDHDSCLLQNIASNLSNSCDDIYQRSVTFLDNEVLQNVNKSKPQILSHFFQLAKLDWTIFDANHTHEEYDSLLPVSLNRDCFDFLYGSALCYAPCHKCLAYLIRYYLSGRCKEVVVVQISDREGFQDLVCMLKEMNIRFTMETMDQTIYSSACQIKVKNMSVSGETTDSVRKYVEYSIPSTSEDMTDRDNQVKAIKTDRESFALLRVFNH